MHFFKRTYWDLTWDSRKNSCGMNGYAIFQQIPYIEIECFLKDGCLQHETRYCFIPTQLYLSILGPASNAVEVQFPYLEAVHIWTGRNRFRFNHDRTGWLWIIGAGGGIFHLQSSVLVALIPGH